MGFTMKATTGGGDYEVPPSGSQPAVCVGLIELGRHENTFQGESKGWQPRVFVVWELAEKKADGKPFYVGRDYTMSLNKKASLRKVIEQWRGKALADDEEFELSRLAGKACLLQLVHKTSQNDREYAKIDGVSSLPKGMPAPAAGVKPVLWTIDSGEPIPAAEWLPFVYGEPLKTVIERSQEYKEGLTPAGAAAGGGDDEIAF